jgi:hypothetical protein
MLSRVIYEQQKQKSTSTSVQPKNKDHSLKSINIHFFPDPIASSPPNIFMQNLQARIAVLSFNNKDNFSTQ